MLPTVAPIFVSSTWLDLQPERHALEDAINRINAGKFVGMEYFGSRPETTEGASLEEVDRSDIYAGIIGGRYGSGITEKEYRRALERALARFIATASLSGAGVGARPQPIRAWCCVNGKIENLDARGRQRREGESYPDEASARRGCRQIM